MYIYQYIIYHCILLSIFNSR
eukprot:UN06625